MPGVTAWIQAAPESGSNARFRAAQRLMLRGPDEAAVLDVASSHALVGHAGYAAYPVRTWLEPGFAIVLEGHVYDRSEPELRHDLRSVFERAFAQSDALGVVSEFVASADGDFLIVAVDLALGRTIAFSDALGRLPIYLQCSRSELVIARECKFIASLQRGWGFDRLGLAQHFWLGYPLGERTLFEGIERAPEGFFVDVRAAGRRIEVRRAACHALRCDFKSDERSLGASAAELVSRFANATETRAKIAADAPAVVSLSGGHDSRSVLAAVTRARSDSIAATFRRADGGQADDVRIAERVAQSLGVRWECVDLPSESLQSEARLVWMKDGLNYAAMAFIVPFLDEIVRRWSASAVLLTGDGGDKLFPDLRPPRRARTLAGLVDIVADDNMLMPAGEVEGLFGLAKGELAAGLREHLERYPEQSADHKAVRMRVVERSRKWLFEGEDRNRCFLWQTSPCFALPVFEAAMRVPDEHKVGLRLYAEVQRRLDPALLEVPHADTGMLIDSRRLRVYSTARHWARWALGPMRRAVLPSAESRQQVSTALRADTLARLQAAAQSNSSLMQMVHAKRADACVAKATRHELYNWRTVLVLERLWQERISGARAGR